MLSELTCEDQTDLLLLRSNMMTMSIGKLSPVGVLPAQKDIMHSFKKAVDLGVLPPLPMQAPNPSSNLRDF